MFRRIFFVLAIPIVLGQNYTTCDPTTNSNCLPIPGFSSATTSFNFSSNYPQQDFTLFNPSANTIIQDAGGLHITINALGEYPYLETNGIVIMGIILTIDYLFYGRVTATLKSTNATTIGTFFNLETDVNNEVDWQWNGNDSSVNALFYSLGDLRNSTLSPNIFNVTSPHTTFHCICRCVHSNFKLMHWIGLRAGLNGFSMVCLLQF